MVTSQYCRSSCKAHISNVNTIINYCFIAECDHFPVHICSIHLDTKMGIRGLTTFIAQNNDTSFVPYKLHDCNLVIDGNSIASQLYVREFGRCKSNKCAFGGDYDEYGRCVKRFFTLLECCLVKPIVVFDGGREPRKLTTSWARLKSRISLTGSVTPSNSQKCPLPLLMLEVFKWVAARSGATIIICDFEADEEIAALARALSCPLLSFDSDFYIHAIPFYIPFPSLATELTEELEKPSSKNSPTVALHSSVQRYIECSYFSVNRFLCRGRDIGDWRKKSGGSKQILQVEALPLIAALLGNDYVKPQAFGHFLSQIQIPKSHCKNHRQRQIVGLLEWLRLQESLDSAIDKILSHTKKGQRVELEKIIRDTVKVYVGCSSKIADHLKLTPMINTGEQSKRPTTLIADESQVGTEAESANCEERKATGDEAPSAKSSSSSSNDEGSDISDSEGDNELDSFGCEQDIDWEERIGQLPAWFLERFRKCDLPPPFMDILMLRTYLCPPQVEDHSQPHSHAISFPILSAIVRLLTPSIESPLKCMTRIDRHAATLNLDPFPKQSSWPSPENILCTPACDRICIIFQSLNLVDDCEEKNRTRKLYLESLPSDWRLLALILAYWIRTGSQHESDERYLIAACFCVIVLRVIDQRAGPPGSRRARKEKRRQNPRRNDATSHGCQPVSSVIQRQSNISDFKIDNFISNTEQNPCTPNTVENLNKRPKSIHKSVKELLQSVSTAECIEVAGSSGIVYQMRQVDGSSETAGFINRHNGKRPRAFNVAIVHCFAELQSIILHVSYLNSLLGNPFVQNAPQTSFSGTMAYNAYYEIHGKFHNTASGKSVWECLLGTSSPSLEKLMDEFFKSVKKIAFAVDDCEKQLADRKRKKKKRSKKLDSSDRIAISDEIEAAGHDEVTVIDPENKFSVLGFVE